jgi:plasmid stability protein
MASLQIVDMPDDVYEALAERAQMEQRSVEEQAIADLARISEVAARRAHAAIEWLRHAEPLVRDEDALDSVQLVREDRDR